MLVDAGHFLESDGIVNGNRRRSDTNPENDQPFPELRLSSVREFPGSIQCIPDIWLRRVPVARKRRVGKGVFIEQVYWHGPLYAFAHAVERRRLTACAKSREVSPPYHRLRQATYPPYE
jgi:hypothetical protein